MDYTREEYIEKAKNLLKVAELLYKMGLYNDSFSRLYYSLRALARGLCGKPVKNKWKHEALINCFVKEFLEEKLSLYEKRMIRKMPSLRNKVDYEPVEISKDIVDIYMKIVKRVFEEMNDGY